MSKGSRDAPGILTIFSSSNVKTLPFGKAVPKQTCYLERVRVEFDTQAHALAARVIYVDMPWLSGNQLIDVNPGRFMLPILLDNDVVTSYTTKLPLSMSHEVHETSEIRIYDSNFNLITGGFAHITLQISFQQSYIS
jgi:hypothetical protein